MDNNVKLTKDGNCYYLTQNLAGMSLYQRTKAIKKFVNQETKVLEECVDKEIRDIFQRNGINVYATEENVLNGLFYQLNQKGKDIVADDFYKDTKFSDCVLVGTSKNNITVWLENDTILQCAVEVKEIDYGKKY